MNTVWHIYPEAAVITIDADGVSYTSPNGSEKWTLWMGKKTEKVIWSNSWKERTTDGWVVLSSFCRSSASVMRFL